MICPGCRKENPDHMMFCMGCGQRLQRAPAGEPGAAPPAGNPWAAAAAAAGAAAAPGVAPGPGPRCAACGSERTVQGAVGPQMGARVFPRGQQVDVPIAGVKICADCGHVALAIADDVRRYLVGMLGG
jgi:hypothetical protein